jgi:hypothetical protein
MIRGAFVILALSVSLSWSAVSEVEVPQTSEAKVANAINTYDEAWNRKDVAAFDQIFAADYGYFASR